MGRPGIVNRVLDLLFPPRCPWCDEVPGPNHVCAAQAGVEARTLPPGPLPAPRPGQPWRLLGAWACWRYEEPVRGVILRMKFENERNLAVPMGEKLAGRFAAERLAALCDVLAPVPMSPKSARRRGYNQSALLALELARHTGLPCLPGALAKTRETPAQSTLDRAGRLTNVAGAYVAEGDVHGKRVLLIDDILTTGSTLNECAATLLAAGAAECRALCCAASQPELLEG